jgi:hypothetical protein
MDVRFGIQDQTFPPKTMNDALRSLAAPQDSTISMAASEGKADAQQTGFEAFWPNVRFSPKRTFRHPNIHEI